MRALAEKQDEEKKLYKDVGVDWRLRLNKQAAVQAATARAARLLGASAPARSALVMPAGPWQDVTIGLESGLYSPETRFLAIERNPRVFLDMVDASWRVGMRHRPDCRRASLHEVTDLPPGLDSAFLDLCAAMDIETSLWVRDHLVPALAPGAVVIVTLPTDGMDRNNLTPKAARDFFGTTRKDILDDLQDRICYHRTVQAISEEAAISLALAMSALAAAGLPEEPTILRPYRDGLHSMTLAILATTGRPGDFPPLDDVLGRLPKNPPRASPTPPEPKADIADPVARAVAHLEENRLQRERLIFRLAELASEDAAIIESIRGLAPAAEAAGTGETP